MRDGRVLADAIVLSHNKELAVLRRQCPEAVAAAVVAGDPCFDRLVASLPHRSTYRAALGVHDSQELVVVSSTWGQQSLFGRNHDLIPRLLDELDPAGFRVAALVHPAVWFGHGPRQIRAWLAHTGSAPPRSIQELSGVLRCRGAAAHLARSGSVPSRARRARCRQAGPW